MGQTEYSLFTPHLLCQNFLSFHSFRHHEGKRQQKAQQKLEVGSHYHIETKKEPKKTRPVLVYKYVKAVALNTVARQVEAAKANTGDGIASYGAISTIIKVMAPIFSWQSKKWRNII